jgi:hypothetical protein
MDGAPATFGKEGGRLANTGCKQKRHKYNNV